jgi:hypothetical protein
LTTQHELKNRHSAMKVKRQRGRNETLIRAMLAIMHLLFASVSLTTLIFHAACFCGVECR